MPYNLTLIIFGHITLMVNKSLIKVNYFAKSSSSKHFICLFSAPILDLLEKWESQDMFNILLFMIK